MCGILCRFSGGNVGAETSGSGLFDELRPKIVERGPDYSNLFNYDEISFFSSVLSLRTPFTEQPLVSSDYIVQFNGELYNDDITGNDTLYIQQLLSSTHDITETIYRLKGEFAILIYDKSTKIISFARDPLGKRSLVYGVFDDELIVSSVHPLNHREQFIDCGNGTIHQYDTTSKKLLDPIPNNTLYTINPNTDVDYVNKIQRISSLKDHLTQSVKQRITTIHQLQDTDALFSVLFSGGLDCTVLVTIAATLLPADSTINLLTVGFDNPRTGTSSSQTPDRILARSSWKHLQSLYPKIHINLIEIDVSFEEYQAIRPKVIELMYPKNTEMDLSIAIAFYFASRGEGTKYIIDLNNPKGITTIPNYKSKAKVLISGLGADELYGGYHKFVNKDIDGLVIELNKQIDNIHERNLQRDDKVISSNGVEVRYPFLDDDVVRFSTESIEINYKISKFILRELANSMGLSFVSEEPKRAIQFGAKSAKMTSNGNKKGTDSLS